MSAKEVEAGFLEDTGRAEAVVAMRSSTDGSDRAQRVAGHGLVALKRILPPVILIGLLVGGWWWYAEVTGIRPSTLPSPLRVLQQGWRFRGALWDNAKPTLIETFVGFSLSVAMGTVLAVIIDFSKFARHALYPILVASQTLPIVAIAPLMVIWFGFGLLPKIIVVILVTFFPITVGWVDGFRSTEGEAMNLLTSMGAKRVKIFRYVRLPSALPYFFSGLRIGITYAVVGAIFAEYVGAKTGLGIFMLLQKNTFRTDLVLAAVAVTALISLTLFASVSVLQRLVIPWYGASRKHSSNA